MRLPPATRPKLSSDLDGSDYFKRSKECSRNTCLSNVSKTCFLHEIWQASLQIIYRAFIPITDPHRETKNPVNQITRFPPVGQHKQAAGDKHTVHLLESAFLFLSCQMVKDKPTYNHVNTQACKRHGYGRGVNQREVGDPFSGSKNECVRVYFNPDKVIGYLTNLLKQ